MLSGMSETDMAKLCATTVAEVLKQLSLEGNKMERSNASNSIKHVVPVLMKDDLNEFGMSHVEVANYLREHRVRTQLQTDAKLQNMTIDKLKAYFDKH